MWLNALRAAGSFDEIKDWNASEQLAISTYINTLFDLCFDYLAQANIRRLAAQYCCTLGDDTKAIWTDVAWATYNMLLERLPLPLLPQVAELVYSLQPIIQFSDPVRERNIPPGFALQWIPYHTYAEALALRGTLLAQLEGLTWMKKVSLPVVMGTIAQLFKQPARVIRIAPTNEFIWLWHEMPLSIDDGGTHTWYSSETICNSENWDIWTEYYFLPGTEPYPLWGFKTFYHPYDGTYNLMGCLYDGQGSNNLPGLTYANGTTLNPKYSIALISFANTTTTITQLTHPVGELNTVSQIWGAYKSWHGLDASEAETIVAMFYGQSTGATVWTDAALNTVTSLWQAQRGLTYAKQQKSQRKGGQQRRGRSKPMGDHRAESFKRREPGSVGHTEPGNVEVEATSATEQRSETRKRRSRR